MKSKKCILILGKIDEQIEKFQEDLRAELQKLNMLVLFVQAKDGYEASMKVENQKYDAIIVDPNVPRLFEGGFVDNISVHKNTSQSPFFVISQEPQETLPTNLQSAHFLHKPLCVQDLVSALMKAMLKSEGGNVNSQFAVDVRVVNAVIKSTIHVCGQYGLQNVQMQKPEPKQMQSPLSGEMASLMPIRSRAFNGAMVVSFDKQSYLQMVSTMFGEEQTEINADNADAIGEINNIIMGNAKPDFTQYGVEMSIPQILQIGQPLQAPFGSARISIPFFLEKGKFYIEVIAYPSKL